MWPRAQVAMDRLRPFSTLQLGLGQAVGAKICERGLSHMRKNCSGSVAELKRQLDGVVETMILDGLVLGNEMRRESCGGSCRSARKTS